MKRLALILATSFVAVQGASVHAGLLTAYVPVAVNDYSGGHIPNQSYGDIFTPNVDIIVRELGILDFEGDGLLEDIQVGIFRNSDESLLVSTTLNAGMSGTLIDNFRYRSVAPTLLHAGTSYTITAHVTFNLDVTGRTSVSGIAVDPALSITAPANLFRLNSFQLEFPSDGFGTGEFYVGPNFRFRLAQEVPEPASLTLLGLGSLGLLAVRRRRRPLA